MFEKVNTIKGQLIKDYKVLKEIDFSDDIDADSSDKFHVNTKEGYLEFLMGIKEKIRFEDFTVLLGESVNSSQGVEMLPIPANHVNLPYKRCMMLVNKIFDLKQFNCIYLDFNNIKSMRMLVILGNKRYFNIINRINEYGSTVWEKVNSIDVKTLSYCIDENKTYLTKNDGAKKNIAGLTEVPPLKEQANFFINCRKYTMLNGAKITCNYPYLFEDGYYCLNLICDMIGDLKVERNTCINNLLLGVEEGFLYLKPLKINEDETEVFTICSGKPIIQYFLHEENKWIDLVGNIKLKYDKELAVRVKMKGGERIYSILLLKRKTETKNNQA